MAEIVGCYLPWLVLRQGKPIWLLLPAAASLALFAWLLTLHPTAAGRTYAAYGGVYIAVALVWLRLVDGVTLTRRELDWSTNRLARAYAERGVGVGDYVTMVLPNSIEWIQAAHE